jgi:hypothetical protein
MSQLSPEENDLEDVSWSCNQQHNDLPLTSGIFSSSKKGCLGGKDLPQLPKHQQHNVVQIITDNATNYVVTGRILMERHRSLFWILCIAHFIDLMLEDISTA